MIQPEHIFEVERQIQVAVRSVRRDGTIVLKAEISATRRPDARTRL